MTTQHTPGPWTTHTTDGGACYVTDNHRFSDAKIIIRIDSGLYGAEEAEGNAKLIAAAPDMFEALRLVRVHLMPGLGKRATVKQKWAAMAAVREALAKVEPQ